MKDNIYLEIQIRRCVTCHGSENLVKATHYIYKGVKRQYYSCRPHNRAKNVRYYYKNKYKGNKW